MTQSGHRSYSKGPPLLASDMLMWRIGQAAPLRGCMSIQQVRRREFVAGLGAAAWPVVAHGSLRWRTLRRAPDELHHRWGWRCPPSSAI